MDNVHISVIIPVGNRHDDLSQLHQEYKAALEGTGQTYEFIYIIDGMHPAEFEVLNSLRREGDPLAVLQLGRSFGEATSLMVGFERASGEVILTLPAYYQVEASEIPKILDALENCDMAIARRFPRSGGWFEHFRRKLFHGLIAAMTDAAYSDLGCGVRAFRRAVSEEITLYGDQHRFLPLLASRLGFSVKEIDAKQSPKDYFEGRYRGREYVHRLLDILTVFFLIRFTKKPLRFFGIIGTIVFVFGTIFLINVVGERLLFHVPLADRPALILSSLLVVLGIQVFSLGLIGELIIFTHARDLKEYRIREEVNFSDTVVSGETIATERDIDE